MVFESSNWVWLKHESFNDQTARAQRTVAKVSKLRRPMDTPG